MRYFMIRPECSFGMQHPESIREVYQAGRILPIGTIIPESFKGIRDIENLYIPKNYLEEVEIGSHELEMLYMLWPNIRPRGYKAQVKESQFIGPNLWYKIEAPNARGLSSIAYGVSALMDIPGICKAGDMALVGDVVPSAFFSGLDDAQMEEMQRMGVVKQSWLSTYSPALRGEYMRFLARPVMKAYWPPKSEREALYKRYPAANSSSQALPPIAAQDETLPVKPQSRKVRTQKG